MASQRQAAPATPRRSRRHLIQPLVQAAILGTQSSTDYTWASEPIGSRPATRDDLPVDDEEWNPERDPGTTTFYAAYVHDVSAQLAKIKRAKKAKGALPQNTTYRIGDTVLVHTVAKEASIAVITAMWAVAVPVRASSDDEESSEEGGPSSVKKMRDHMAVSLHWFTRPQELPRVRHKRAAAYNEIYYTLKNSSVLQPSSILSPCTVSAARADALFDGFLEDDDETKFVCLFAANTARGLFYAFDWDAHHTQALGAGKDAWALKPDDRDVDGRQEKGEEKKPRKIRKPKGESSPVKRKVPREGTGTTDVDESSDGGSTRDAYDPAQDLDGSGEPMDAELSGEDDGAGEHPDEDEDIEPRTPSKRHGGRPRGDGAPRTPRKHGSGAPTTPSRRGRKLAAPTPHSKAALRARKKSITVRPPPPQLSQEHYRALAKLPQDPWLRAMHVLHVAARPDELPCRDEEYARVLRSVRELIEEGSGGCVYISGVPGTGKTATVHAVVRELKRMAEDNETDPFTYVEINGLRIPEPSAAYSLLWEGVSGHDVAVDGHLKISSKEALKSLTQYFGSSRRGLQGPSGQHACVVLMDELDQLVTSKQDVVYNFFNWPTLVDSRLVVIAVANTMDLPERVMSGRVRSRLGMIRINFQPYTTPQLEQIVHARLATAKASLADAATAPDVLAPDGVKFAAMKVASISGDARRVLDVCRRAAEEARGRTARVGDVSRVLQVMQNSPTAAFVRECSVHERVMLAATLKCARRAGVDEVPWGEVLRQHQIYSGILPGSDDPVRQPNEADLGLVLDALVAARALLLEDGGRRPMEERRCMLNLEQGEVERVLGEVGGQRWKAALVQ